MGLEVRNNRQKNYSLSCPEKALLHLAKLPVNAIVVPNRPAQRTDEPTAFLSDERCPKPKPVLVQMTVAALAGEPRREVN